jgi:hypothetical protein
VRDVAGYEGVWRGVTLCCWVGVSRRLGVNSAFIFMASGPVQCTLRSLQMRRIHSFETSGNTQQHCVMSSNSRPSVEPQSCLSLVSVFSHLSPIHTHTHTHTHTHRFFEFPSLHFLLQVISSLRFWKPKVHVHFAYLPCMLHDPPCFVHPNRRPCLSDSNTQKQGKG